RPDRRGDRVTTQEETRERKRPRSSTTAGPIAGNVRTVSASREGENAEADHACGAAAAATAVATAQPAVAADLQASGTAQASSLVFTDVRSADGNTILEGVQEGVIGGTFTGTWVEQFRLVVHPDGATNFHSFLTVVGTADGCGTGTILRGSKMQVPSVPRMG